MTLQRRDPNGDKMNNDYDIVSDLYDVYVQFDFDIHFYLNRYSDFDGKALELMAGTGRLSIPLLKNNVSLDCVDLSRGLLNRLHQKLIVNNLKSNLFCRDICTLDLPDKYDLVIIGCNSFAEITEKNDRNKVIRSVYGLLNNKGELIITLHNPPVRRKSIDSGIIHVNDYKTDDKIISFSITSQEDPDAVVHLKQFYEIYDNNGCMVEKRMIDLNFALLSRNEIEQELVMEGFEIKEVFGNFDNSKFNDSDSQYIIIVASKGLRH